MGGYAMNVVLSSCFSALQRAENSSILTPVSVALAERCFSALQRAENSSILNLDNGRQGVRCGVSVLFSEPKIPQYAGNNRASGTVGDVSVLFSEPKIPQLKYRDCAV